MGLFNRVTHRVRKEVIENPYVASKIDPSNYERVVAYGCSFTAGDEIVDHELLGMTFEEVNKLKKSYNSQNDFYTHHEIDLPHPLMQYSSWAGQLAKLCKLEFVSYANPGFSLGQSYFDLYNHYKSGLVTDKDLILIGLTSPTRITYFDQEKKFVYSSPLHNYIEMKRLSYPAKKAVLDVCDENMMTFQYFNQLHCINVMKHFLNIRIQPMSIYNTVHRDKFMFAELHKPILKYALSVWDDARDITLLRNNFLVNAEEEGKAKYCGFGHPALEYHTRLAQQIYDNCVLK